MNEVKRYNIEMPVGQDDSATVADRFHTFFWFAQNKRIIETETHVTISGVTMEEINRARKSLHRLIDLLNLGKMTVSD